MKVRKHDTDAITNLQEELANINISDKLDHDTKSNPNKNYNIIDAIITSLITKHFPTKTVKFDKHKHKNNSWITKGIITSIKNKDNLYKQLQQSDKNSPEFHVLKTNFKTYKKLVKQIIIKAKQMYYHTIFDKYKNNIKGTWSTIKSLLNRVRVKSEFPEYFMIENKLVSDKSTLSNKFNEFYTNIGPNLAKEINIASSKSFRSYLKSSNKKNFDFVDVTEEIEYTIINNLKPKDSCGQDGLSSSLLIQLKHILTKPLTIIINQSLRSGIFPDKLKIAKVIPLYKKDNPSVLGNYRPISLLPAISKLFERVLFNQIHDFFNKNNLYYGRQYGFRENIQLS